jgi:hypothetical protein
MEIADSNEKDEQATAADTQESEQAGAQVDAEANVQLNADLDNDSTGDEMGASENDADDGAVQQADELGVAADQVVSDVALVEAAAEKNGDVGSSPEEANNDQELPNENAAAEAGTGADAQAGGAEKDVMSSEADGVAQDIQADGQVDAQVEGVAQGEAPVEGKAEGEAPVEGEAEGAADSLGDNGLESAEPAENPVPEAAETNAADGLEAEVPALAPASAPASRPASRTAKAKIVAPPTPPYGGTKHLPARFRSAFKKRSTASLV